jgi:HAD superfamily hydrolase (TIGR01450 family)
MGIAPRVVADAAGASKTPGGNLVCDLDGVVYLGGEPIPGAGAALQAVERRGYRILFVTNNSTTHRVAVAGRISELSGYPARAAQVLTSGMVAASMLAGRVRRVLAVGEPGLADTLVESGYAVTGDWREAQAVVVGLDRSFDYQKLLDAVRAVRAGARLVATNLDPTYPTPEGLWPGGGAVVAAIATGAEVTPEVAGKPFAAMRDLVRAELGPGPTWVVGDRVDTDLELARGEGWGRILVLSGATPSADGIPPDDVPDVVLNSAAELDGYLR